MLSLKHFLILKLMNYEFDKYKCTTDSVKNKLEEYGVAIIPNLLNNEECDNMNDGVWNFFEHISQNWQTPFSPIKRKDKSSWNNIFHLNPIHSQLFKTYSIGHSQVLWDIRQNPKIVEPFAKIWNCDKEDLFVSFDALSFCLPPEITGVGWEKNNNSWFHTDQSYTRNNFECVQSWITANDIDEGDATLSIMEGSHKYHEEFRDKYSVSNTNDWYLLNKEEEEFYSNKKCEYKRIKCPKGSLVLWDSRTIHHGTNPVKNRKNQNTRSIAYLCYMPKNKCNELNYNRKIHAFNNLYTTTHWPCKIVCSLNEPNFNSGLNPGYTPIQPPRLTTLGESLVGL